VVAKASSYLYASYEQNSLFDMFTLRPVGKYRNPNTIKKQKMDNLYIFEHSGVKRLYNIAQAAC
jgi:hypothetical protein